MPNSPFASSAGYSQSIQGLHRLHLAALRGENESPEADAIRDDLEKLWFLLSETEMKRITGLSEDLYSISNPPSPSLPMTPQAQQNLTEAEEARRAGDWDRSLEQLRRWNRFLEPSVLSYLRGSIWQEAGDPETAALFFEHAARLRPDRATPMRM